MGRKVLFNMVKLKERNIFILFNEGGLSMVPSNNKLLLLISLQMKFAGNYKKLKYKNKLTPLPTPREINKKNISIVVANNLCWVNGLLIWCITASILI